MKQRVIVFFKFVSFGSLFCIFEIKTILSMKKDETIGLNANLFFLAGQTFITSVRLSASSLYFVLLHQA